MRKLGKMAGTGTGPSRGGGRGLSLACLSAVRAR
jgi:hypothetical protein